MMQQETKDKIKRLIQETIRPTLLLDGGDIQLVEITDDGVVRVRLKGACAQCPFSAMTLALSVEDTLKKEIPQVTRVEPVQG